MSNNTNLHHAKKAKNDEFYTRIEDIEKELKYYKDFFKGKVVYCNCDRADGENRTLIPQHYSLTLFISA